MSLPALKDLFAKRRDRATGVWRLGLDPCRTIFLDHGDVVFAASNHPLDRLTHLLVERGKITQAQLDYAMANLNPAMSIGKNLIEMGFITQRDLLDVARAQVERVVWACMAGTSESPAFEAKELDAATVRLPFDTAAMLLSGVLNLQDRERLLEVLGPLNQVVVLEGKRHQELTLPPDLVRIPALLDGSRTLLELSRESGVEPFRLGASRLFLREWGWARRHGLPPLDRRARGLALAPPPAPPISPALPDPPPEPQPSLFAEIQASQFPTTNLEHLSEALDQLGPEDEVEPPSTPPPQPLRSPEPSLPIHHSAAGSTQDLVPPPPPVSAPSRRPWVLLALLLVSLALWGGLRWYKRNPVILPKLPQSTGQNPGPVAPKLEPPAPKAAPEPEAKAPPETEAVPPPAPAPSPAAAPKPEAKAPSVPSKGDRLQAILDGNLKLATTQGAAQRKSIQGKWTLRLEIACQGGTIQHAAGLLKGRDPDLFILPMAMRDGRTCYQVFLGSYGSEAAARDAAKRLPSPFLAEGNRPKPFRVAQIPDRQ